MKTALSLLALTLLAATTVGVAQARPPKPDKRAKAALDKLIPCAEKNDSACLREAAEALQARGAKAACPLLASAFAEAPERAHPVLADQMVQLRCPELAATARTLFANTDSDMRGPVAVALARSREASLFEPVAELLAKGRPFDQEKACEALALLGDKRAVKPLVKAAGNSFFSVRLQAAAALANFPGAPAREALCKMAGNDANSGVRLKAAESLGKHKDKAAVPCLTKVLADAEGRVKTAAHQALVAVTGLDVGMDPEAWNRWWQKNQNPGRGSRRY